MYGESTAEMVSHGVRYRFVGVGAVGTVVLSVIFSIASTQWGLAVGIWAVIAGYTGYQLGQSRSDEAETSRSEIGIANGVTLLRGWLLALFAGVVLSPPSTLVLASLFAVAVGLDAVDGAIARRTAETAIGARLDSATDSFAVLIGAAAAVSLGSLPVWYLLAGGIWYVYAAALGLRRRASEPVYDLPESRLRPLVGSAQFLVIAIALLVGDTVWLPLFAGGALMALTASFTRDWAAATGRFTSADSPTGAPGD